MYSVAQERIHWWKVLNMTQNFEFLDQIGYYYLVNSDCFPLFVTEL